MKLELDQLIGIDRGIDRAIDRAIGNGPDPAATALAAIASTYQRARAGIISGPSSPLAAPSGEASPRGPAPTGPAPTVRPALPSSGEAARPAERPPVGEDDKTATFWSRLLGRGGPVRRGRHSVQGRDLRG